MTTFTRASLLFAAVVVMAAGTSQAQYIVPVGGDFITWHHHSSTPAEGYMRGHADLIRSCGYANLLDSQAALNYTVVNRNMIENQVEGTKAYFSMRAINRQARLAERGPRQTAESRFRIARQSAPKRLSPSEFDAVAGEINWPVLLRYDSLSQKRAVLEQVFHDRADNGAMNAQDFTRANDTIKTLMADLKGAVKRVPPTQYTEAKQFLQALAFETGQPVR